MKKALLVALAVSAAVITFGEAPDLTSQLEFIANPKTGVDVSKRPLLCLAAPPEDPVVPSGSVDVTSALVDLGCPAAGKYKGTDFTNLTARACLRLLPYRGRIYVGMGDYTYNCGPVPVMSIDPQTGDSITEFTAGTEAIDDFKVFSDGCLYVPSLDEKEGATNHGHFFRRDTNGVWTVFNSVPKGSTGSSDAKLYTHCWDLAEYNGKIHFAGYGTASSTFTCTNFTANTSPKFIARTTNVLCYVNNTFSGFHRQLNYLNRIYSLIEVGDELYGIPKLPYTPTYPYADSQDADKPYLWHYNKAQNKFVKENTEWSRLIPDMTLDDAFWYSKTVLASTYSVGTSDVIVEKTLTFGDKGYYIVTGNYMPWIGCVARIVDGKFTAAKLDFGTATWPQEFIKDGDAVYALCYSMDGNEVVNKVFKSVDGDNFTEILHFRHRQYATAMCRYNGSFFFSFGTQEEIYRSSHPTAAGYTKSLEYNGVILRCADPGSDQPVVEHTHVWGNWVTNVFPTATAAGERYRECTAEGCTNPVARETETIPATGGGEDPVEPPAGQTTITLTAPADGSMYDTHLQALKKYLANSDARSEFPDDDLIAARDTDGNHYVHNAWFTNLLVEASVEQATYKPFTWEKTGDITDIVVEYSEDADFTEGNVISEKYCRDNETSTRPLNLKLATKYWWRVKAKDANGGDVVSDVRTFTTEGVAPRIIGTLGFNMRDLGGGTNAEGLVVRQGVILRGKCPMARVNAEAGWNDQKMTEQSYREFYLDKHHIKTELDLRSADEALEHQTKYDEIEISAIGIRHFNMEIYPYHYGHQLTSSNICQAVKMLAEGTHYPVYFNCAVGSDRTGTFGTIIDGIVGRDDQWFYDNYELPSFDSGLARLRYNRKGSEMFEYLQARNPGEHFRDRVVQYLLGIGVTREEIRAIREAMLELPPEGDARELKSAKAVYTEADQTLTLRYDDQDYSGVDGQSELALSRSAWIHLTNDVRHIVFAPSFADYRVESCLQWFENFKALEYVTGLENFDTSLTTTLRGMFTGCSSLTEIDFSGHNLPKCTNLGNMFYKCSGLKSVDFSGVATSNVIDFYRTFSGCSNLTNIYVSEEFDASGYTDLTKEVFKSCSKLVGGAGTKYNSEHINIEYARIDNPPDAPGYFTLKGAEPVDPPVVEHKHVWGPWVTNKVATATESGERYRECTASGCSNPPERQTETIPATGGGDEPDPQEDDPVAPYPADPEDPDADLPEDAELAARAVRIGDTIRFYYDKKSHAQDGTVVTEIPVAGTRTWLSPGADNFEITNVIFYSSFKSFKPQSMASWFQYYRALKSVVGLHNIDTSDVKRMDNLFRCKSGNNPNIIDLDLSAWDTRSCMNMSYMFARLSGLKTIYVSDKFVVTQVTTSASMFDKCYVLTGEKNTVAYINTSTAAHELDKTCAKVDGGTEDPGYFTYKATSSGPVIVKPELGSATIVTGESKSFRIAVSNPVVGAAYTLFTAAALDGEFTAEADSTVYASGDLLLDFAIEDDKPQKFAKIVISTTSYKQGDPLPEE